MSNLAQVLAAKEADAYEAFMAAHAQLQRGDIDKSQFRVLSDEYNLASRAAMAHEADTSSDTEAQPGADTRMPVDTSWWDSDGYYHAS
jgi:hypothetical protein